MYVGKDGNMYGEMEETVLACLLLKPKLVEKLKIDEKYFKKYGYILTFFKNFYAKYHNLDVAIMFSVIKDTSEITLMDAITYLCSIFVLRSHFEEYQNRLIEMYKISKKENWLRGKIYEKVTKLYLSEIGTKKFMDDINYLIKRANEIEWE